MDHTSVLTPLTHKGTDTLFPAWLPHHQLAFEVIKALVVSCDCLVNIDHDNMGENQIFVTCDASDHCTGAVLSFRKTWKTAQPVAFDSVALKGAQANYLVHEKELLMIIRVLTCWCTDLLGSPITIYADHCTLENFNAQKDLSRCQARWQEFLTHNHRIIYIKGEDDTVVDAMSCLPDLVDDTLPIPVESLLMVGMDLALLKSIVLGYKSDPFCEKLLQSADSLTAISVRDGLLYVSN